MNPVEGYAVVDDLHDVIPEIPAGWADYPHIVYRLGPAIPIAGAVAERNQLPSIPVLGPLDLLLTSPTLKDAVAATRERVAATTGEPG